MKIEKILELICSDNEDDFTLGTILLKEYFPEKTKNYTSTTKISPELWKEIKEFNCRRNCKDSDILGGRIDWDSRLSKMRQLFL